MSERRVKVADHAVGSADEVLATIGLGSCVAIILHAPKARVGALAHALLPDEGLVRGKHPPAKFASSAVPLLVEDLRQRGITEPLVAKLAGGAAMFANLLKTGGVNMGERNVEAARVALRLANIPIVAEDVGGDSGRSVYYTPVDGKVTIRSLRGGDRVL
jgi:chemotaxis protein CheD